MLIFRLNQNRIKMEDKKKRQSSTITITHESFGDYYIKADESQFAVHKHIPSGHLMQAKGYYTTLGGAVNFIFDRLVQEKIAKAIDGEAIDIKQYIDTYNAERVLFRQALGDFLDVKAVEA